MGLLDKLAGKVSGGSSSNRPNNYPASPGGYGQSPVSPTHGGAQYGGGYGGQPGYGAGGGAAPHHTQQSSYAPPPSMDSKPKEDDRPLPTGWVKQWDNNYSRYFYVDTKATPPRSIWVHPDDENKSPTNGAASAQYAPPSGPPHGGDSRGWGHQQPSGYGQPAGYGYGQPAYGGGYPQQQPMYGQQPMMMQQQQGRGRFGGGGGGGGMGMGMMGGAALGVGAGMLGGALIADGMNDSYQDGYQDGQMDDMGGGDMGGGDF